MLCDHLEFNIVFKHGRQLSLEAISLLLTLQNTKQNRAINILKQITAAITQVIFDANFVDMLSAFQITYENQRLFQLRSDGDHTCQPPQFNRNCPSF